MEISIILAKFWGWFLIVSCLVYIRSKSLEEVIELARNKAFLMIFGYISFVLGLVSIILHNLWVSDWRVVITIFGWMALFKGIVNIGFPELSQKWAEKFRNKLLLTKILLIIGIILGAWLLWLSC
ncbi:MAG: hypothetical protein ACP5IX_03065 [Patescibacteria group bacterium]